LVKGLKPWKIAPGKRPGILLIVFKGQREGLGGVQYPLSLPPYPYPIKPHPLDIIPPQAPGITPQAIHQGKQYQGQGEGITPQG
jgi:hypothetical protein